MYSTFAKVVGAELAEVEQPLSDYPTFSSFFARRLRKDARDFSTEPNVMSSPCDGRILSAGHLESGLVLQAKGQHYSLSELLGDNALANKLEGGSVATFYLSPRDYHRVHAPCSMKMDGYRHIPGTLFPVGPKSAAKVPKLFASNERVVIPFTVNPRSETNGEEPERDDSNATVGALIMVAALGVGNIELTDPGVRLAEPRRFSEGTSWTEFKPRKVVANGQDVGAFHLGSTVILCLNNQSLSGLEHGQVVAVGESLRTYAAGGGAS